MKHPLIAIALVSSFAIPALAVDAMVQSPTCKEFMEMDSAGQVKSMEMMHESMAKNATVTSNDMMPDAMAAHAMDACTAEPDGTVGDAMKMMEGS